MDKTITITGPATCEVCALSGGDGDSCRANKLEGGRIFCILCKSFSSPIDRTTRQVYGMPLTIRNFVATMLREQEPDAPALTLTVASFGPDGSSSQAAAACAQGNESVVLNAGALTFSADAYGLSRLEVRFSADMLEDLPAQFCRADASALDDESQQLLRNLRLHSCPPVLEAAIGKLISLGFSVRHLDFSGQSMRHIQLHCGGTIAGTELPKGIMVEATYLI
jgi:hypothetical protein